MQYAYLLFLLLPLGTAVYMLWRPKHLGGWLAAQMEQNPWRIRILIVFAMLGCAAGAGLGADILDFSELVTEDGEKTEEEWKTLRTEFTNTYHLPIDCATNITCRVEHILARSNSSLSPASRIFWFLALGVLSSLYVLTHGAQISAEAILGKRIETLRDSERSKTRDLQLTHELHKRAQSVARMMEEVVYAKMLRVKKVSHQLSSNASVNWKACLALEPQYQAYVSQVHSMLKSREFPQARLHVALYEPDGNRLVVRESTNGMPGGYGVVRSPNTIHKLHFELDTPSAQSKAVEAFRGRVPIIIPVCTKENFTYFGSNPDRDPEQDIRSFCAIPLVYSDSNSIGVLVADSNESNYFVETDVFERYLREVGTQLALRLMYEQAVRGLISAI